MKCLYKSCNKVIFYIYIHLRTHIYITHVHTHTHNIFQISDFQHQISIPGNLEANNISILYILKNIQGINWQVAVQFPALLFLSCCHQLAPRAAGILKAKEATVTAPLLGLSWSRVKTLDVTGQTSKTRQTIKLKLKQLLNSGVQPSHQKALLVIFSNTQTAFSESFLDPAIDGHKQKSGRH